MAKKEIASGICIDPIPPSTGEKLSVEYSGKLAANAGITLCVSYGTPPNHLFSQQEFTMQKQNQQWAAAITVTDSDAMNLSFKDNNGSIDDNQGKYYRTDINSNNLSYA